MPEPMRIAVLIDSENISAAYIGAVLDEVAAYGVASIRRIYGDWTSAQASKWKNALLDNSLSPIQQFSNISGKNSTDSAMIIDAMDILYSGAVEGFCIVSSDSDFTRLASRLRESGCQVIGIGEEKTPLALRKACTRFVTLENLLKQSTDTAPTKQNILKEEKVERAIADILAFDDGAGKRTRLSEVGTELGNKYSDFDVRNYGYTSLSRFVDSLSRFNLEKDGHDYFVTMCEESTSKDAVIAYIRSVIKAAPAMTMGLSELGNTVKGEFPDFDQRNYGFAQFSKFVASLDGIVLGFDMNNQIMAMLD